ncbi:unnamed protein product [Rotaria sordida]|uniref:Uncharacterized protein n=1 Tax=Rotaria sordida TaxID=392033 RepID=A0A813TBK0_9BILA|nr:unnamed protein product [Rotaria sordida]
MAEKSHYALNCFNYRHQQTCLIKFILSIFIIIFFILSHIFFTKKPTFHLNNSNYIYSQILQCTNRNKTRIEEGQKYLSQNRVIICGLIRDRETHIKRLKQQLNEITIFFADYAIVIVENDSKDNTRHELINWAKIDKHIHIIDCNNEINSISLCNLSLVATNIKSIPDILRIEKMVQLRNIYMNYIDKHNLLKQFDYVIIEDFDLTTYTYLNGLFSTGFYLKYDSTIDAICSNGIFYNKLFGNMITYETYFDPYAHKDKQNQNWSKIYNDIWSTIFRKYSCNEGLIHVQSCFSGRTIYRYKSIKGKRYRKYIDQYKQAICENIGLHETIKNVYINSEMIFYITKNNI